MPKLSFMKWYPLDWLRDTGLLSAEARGVWIDVLCLAWNAPERGVYHRLKDDFCRELRIPTESYEKILLELAKVGDVMIGNDSVTIKSRRMIKQERAYKLNAERVARHRSNANVTRSVMAKTLDVRCSQDVRLLKTTAGNGPPALLSLEEFTAYWQAKSDGEKDAAKIAIGLKAYKLSFRVEEDIYKKIIGEEKNGTVHSKSISEQVAQRRRKEGLERIRKDAAPGKILAGLRDLPEIQSET